MQRGIICLSLSLFLNFIANANSILLSSEIYYSVYRNELPLQLPRLELKNTSNTVVAGLAAIKDSLITSTFSITKTTNTQMVPWWNDECERAYRRRKAAWKRLIGNSCSDSWRSFQLIRTSFTRVMSTAKCSSFLPSFLSAPENGKALYRFVNSLKYPPPD